jgi:hypothetical protein
MEYRVSGERTEIFIREVATGTLVSAYLIVGVTAAEVASAEARWRPFLREAIQRLREQSTEGQGAWPEHAHWDWSRKLRRVEGRSGYHLIGIECGGDVQALMLAEAERHRSRLPEQHGRPVVYVEYLATAPWNDRTVTQEPRFGLTGRTLMAAAIEVSELLGYHGRLGLHALPQAEEFYRRVCGMTDLGVDESVEGLRYFEMTTAQAEAFLGRPVRQAGEGEG